jgi:hypothetical protein
MKVCFLAMLNVNNVKGGSWMCWSSKHPRSPKIYHVAFLAQGVKKGTCYLTHGYYFGTFQIIGERKLKRLT